MALVNFLSSIYCVFRYQVGDWVKFRRSVLNPTYGWQGANHKSVGFVQSVPDKDNLMVSFCSGEARVLANEVIKVIPLDRGQHVQLKADVEEPRSVSSLCLNYLTCPTQKYWQDFCICLSNVLYSLASSINR